MERLAVGQGALCAWPRLPALRTAGGADAPSRLERLGVAARRGRLRLDPQMPHLRVPPADAPVDVPAHHVWGEWQKLPDRRALVRTRPPAGRARRRPRSTPGVGGVRRAPRAAPGAVSARARSVAVRSAAPSIAG